MIDGATITMVIAGSLPLIAAVVAGTVKIIDAIGSQSKKLEEVKTLVDGRYTRSLELYSESTQKTADAMFILAERSGTADDLAQANDAQKTADRAKTAAVDQAQRLKKANEL